MGPESASRASGSGPRRPPPPAATVGRRLLLGVLTASLTMAVLPATAALGASDAAGDRGAPPGSAGDPGGDADHPYAEDAVLVEFVPGTPAAQRRAARSDAGATRSEPLSPLAPDAEVLELERGRSVPAAIRSLERNPNVRIAEPDYLVFPTVAPDDPWYANGGLWGLYSPDSQPSATHGSRAADAWADGHTGTSDAYVVVIDTGMQLQHPDLATNVDAQHSHDFRNDTSNVYSGSQDDHGTHVAGTIGAEGNNGIGVVGVNWDVTMISAKFLGPNGGRTSDAVAAVDHATALKVDHGLDIVATNNSWGGGGYSSLLHAAIERGAAQDILFVAAAGNGDFLGRPVNTDASPFYPAAYTCDDGGARDWDCVVSVAATTSTGGFASFSNYGATTVDLGAPGSGIRSTTAGGGYGTKSGTSMAAPHVSGALALCASVNPALDAGQRLEHLFGTVTEVGALVGKTVTGGRLDVGALAAACADDDAPLEIATSSLPQATVDSAYEATLSARGGQAPYGWQAQGLPAGLEVVQGEDARIAGTPTEVTDAEVELTVTDAAGATATTTLDLAVSPAPSLEVAGIDVTISGGRWLRGSALVAVADGDQPAAGVTVAGTWSFSGSSWQLADQATTGSDGRVSLDTGNPKLSGGTYDFCVTSLTLGGEVVTFAPALCSGDVGSPPDDEPEPDPDPPPTDPDPDGPVLIQTSASKAAGGSWSAGATFRIDPGYDGTGSSVTYAYASQRGDVTSGGEQTCTPGGSPACGFQETLHNRDSHLVVTAWVTGDKDATQAGVTIHKP